MANKPWIGRECDNLTGLTELNEKSLLEAIRKRYDSSLVYRFTERNGRERTAEQT